LRRPYRREYARVQRQQEWLIELARLLDPEKARRYHWTARYVKRRVKRFLARLKRETAEDALDASVVRHIAKTVRNRWWGLFTCYRVAQLPATNNEHEVFFNHLKQRHRRVTGRKSVHAFVLRYGPYAAYVDTHESFDELLARLRCVDRTRFKAARREVREHQAHLSKPHRFRHHQAKYLKQLEISWERAVLQSAKRSHQSV